MSLYSLNCDDYDIFTVFQREMNYYYHLLIKTAYVDWLLFQIICVMHC